LDLFSDRIFVFSPKGDLYDLPEAATAVDFAFAVHSDLGLRVQGAKVNGRIVPLETQLTNRDVVEILTRREAKPSRDWLGFVKTAQARNRIRAWFRSVGKEENLASGRSQIEEELKVLGVKRLEDLPSGRLDQVAQELQHKDATNLLTAVGEGLIRPAQIMRRLFPPESKPVGAKVVRNAVATGRVTLAGGQGLPYTLSDCCKPTYPKPIVGYITRGSGVTVHLQGCNNLPAEPDRLMEAAWEVEGPERMVLRLELRATNRLGLLRDIATAVSEQKVDIADISSILSRDRQQTITTMEVEVADLAMLGRLIKKIEQVNGVTGVKRLE
jgi:GTP pyrophosphokinase